MKDFIQKHRFYLSLITLFILFGGIYLFMSTKGDAIIYFSDHRSRLWDAFFVNATRLGEQYVYVLIAVAAMTVRLRYTFLVAATGIIVTIVSHTLKSIFRQDRPFSYFQNEGIIERINVVQGVDLHTGATSLPSGHTMSAFALYGLLALLLYRSKLYGFLLFLLALLTGLSRIYLMQHFAVDVYWGAIVGTLLAIAIYAVNKRYAHSPDRYIDRPLINLRRKKAV